MAHRLLEEQLRIARDKESQSLRAASELELERRNILNAMRHREPERGGLGPSAQSQTHLIIIQYEPCDYPISPF